MNPVSESNTARGLIRWVRQWLEKNPPSNAQALAIAVVTPVMAALLVVGILVVGHGIGWMEFVSIIVGVLGANVALLQSWRIRQERRRAVEALQGLAGPRERSRSPGSVSSSIPPLYPPEQLLEALRSGDCVLFAGAELGALAGLPTWRQLLRLLMGRSALDAEMIAALQQQLESGDVELVADVLAARLSRSDVVETLDRTTELVQPLVSVPLLEEIGKLPVAGVLTDMWAELPERLFADRRPVPVVPGEGGRMPALLRSGAFFVAHLKGSTRDPGTLRLSASQYRDLLDEDRDFDRFLGSLLSTQTILFLGADEQTVERFVQSSRVKAAGPRHYAVLPWEPGLQLRAQGLLGRYGVEVMPFPAESGQRELERFVTALTQALEIRRPRGHVATPRVNLVRLRNIGPFADLELPIHHQATVLLGNNASGKSTVLRAMALVLSGEGADVNDAAQTLLRSGAHAGEVELVLDRERYRTGLHRERGRVVVRADQLSPVSTGLWLGLGFPPLRGIPRRQLRGPTSEGVIDPSRDDVLPLAMDTIDDRLGDVQQWLVNTALRADEGSESGRASRQLLDVFFDIVGEMTPGISFTFDGIDRQSWQVMVRTEDGLVGFDQLSRGMTAVVGWVGVLLQRLYQVYGARPGSQDARSALLLVDEVDLHLHPAWQRQILPLLRRHFPAVQLVVSTHSPLVVGSLPEAGLIHLQRVEGRVVPEIIAEDFLGWRSDQILTGPAFELSSTRDAMTESRLQQYAELLARGINDDESRARADQLAQQLRERLPSPQETEGTRAAADLVRRALNDRLAELPQDRRLDLAAEAERYLKRLRSGA